MFVTTWEYKKVFDWPGDVTDFMKDLNQLGEAGWEVVAVCPGANECLIYVLKRPTTEGLYRSGGMGPAIVLKDGQ